MTAALWIVGYLAAGLITARIVHLTGAADDDGEPDGLLLLCAVAGWPMFAALAAVAGLAVGVLRLVTLPTRAERAAARRKRLDQERDHIRAEARRLGLPLVEDDHE